jgi:hypothetical protein
MGAQFGCRNLGQAAAEFADCGAAGGYDNYIIHLILQSFQPSGQVIKINGAFILTTCWACG